MEITVDSFLMFELALFLADVLQIRKNRMHRRRQVESQGRKHCARSLVVRTIILHAIGIREKRLNGLAVDFSKTAPRLRFDINCGYQFVLCWPRTPSEALAQC